MTCPTCRRPVSDDDAKILTLAARGESTAAIASAIGKTDRTVQRTLERYGAARKKGRPRKAPVAEKKST